MKQYDRFCYIANQDSSLSGMGIAMRECRSET